MSHANIVATVAGVSTVIPNLSKNDVYLAYLPLAHVLELAAEVRTIRAPRLCFLFYSLLTYYQNTFSVLCSVNFSLRVAVYCLVEDRVAAQCGLGRILD